MSNIVEMESTPSLVRLRHADGREWQITRAQIMTIYQGKSGSAAARRQATITDVCNAAQTALGIDAVAALRSTVDFDPNDSNRPLNFTVGD